MLALYFVVNLESEKSAAFTPYLLFAAKGLSLGRVDVAFITIANNLYYKNIYVKNKICNFPWSAVYLCSTPFSMQCGHGATLTFNPNGENTQVDCGPRGNPEL